MRHVAVILAGGTGSRVGGKTPKQLLPLEDGRSILEHSVDAFEQAECIDEIAIVMHTDWIGAVQGLCLQNSWQKVQQIIPGGAERWESSWNALQAYSGEGLPVTGYRERVCLWLHDAARPFVSQRILKDVAKALETNEAVTVAVPVTDTLYQVEGLPVTGYGLRVESIPSRAEYMRAQTPQAFHLEVLKEAFERAMREGKVAATDDVGIVHKYLPEVPITIVAGEEANRKITYAEDLK